MVLADRADLVPVAGARLCRRHQVNCLYMHGTIYEGYIASSPDFLTELNGILRGTGLNLADNLPIPIPAEDVGDSTNHVRPDRKDHYTRLIHGRLQPFLK